MYQPSHVRRNPVNPSTNQPQYGDAARMQSNPQPIPQNPGITTFQRGTPRSFPNYSPAQSPQQHPQFIQPPAFTPGGGTPTEINASHGGGIPVSSSAKSHTNGQQYGMYPGQGRMQYPQHTQPQNMYTSPISKFGGQQLMQNSGTPYNQQHNFQQNTSNMMQQSHPQFVYMPHGQPMRQQRYPSPQTHAGVNPGHTPIQATSPGYYPPPQQYFQSPMTQVSPYAAAYDPMAYQQPTQQPMHTPQMMQQPQPIPQSSSKRKKMITIKDPSTLQDVTKDVLEFGRQEAKSPRSARSTPPATMASVPPQQDHIAAQFAAQVAAAATESPDRPPVQQNVHFAQLGSSPNASVIPSGVDTSVPPPLLPSLPHGLAHRPNMQVAASSSPVLSKPMQVPPSYSERSDGLSHTNAVPKPSSTIQQPPVVPPPQTRPVVACVPLVGLNKTRPDAPVAIVQPVRHQTNQNINPPKVNEIQSKPAESKEKHNEPDIQKIEKLVDAATDEMIEIHTQDGKTDAIVDTKPDTTETQKADSELNVANVAADLADTSEITESSPATEEKSTGEVEVPAPGQIDNAGGEGNKDPKQEDADKAVVVAPAKTVNKVDSTDLKPAARHASPARSATPPIVIVSSPTTPPSVSSIVQASNTDAPAAEAETESAVMSEETDTKETVKPDNMNTKQLPSADLAVEGDGDKNVKTEIENAAKPKQQDMTPSKDVSTSEVQSTITNPVPTQNEINNPKENEKVLQPSTEQNIVDDQDDLNSNKRKVFERSFLMQFRFHNTSMEKPTGLPVIEDIIMDRPLPKSSISNSLPSLGDGYRDRGGSDFTPNYMMGGGGHRGGRQTSRGNRGGGQQRQGYGAYGHSGSQSGPKVIKKVSIQREPDLKKSDNAWKPSKMENKPTGENATEEEQSKEIMRNVRSILNKLTPQKFSQLMQKFQLLAINSEARLRGVIDLIFEKAIDEPNFCEAYANMCRTMSQMRVAAPASGVQNAAQPSTTVEFRKILLTRCQREFEKDRTNEDALGEIRKKLENASTPEEKQQFKEELEYAETKERRRMLGNIRFIGELFKLNMLTESIMHNCIMSLFKGRDEESLESLCRLLTTIGQSLDHVKGKARMDQYLQQIEKIIREKKTSARVRFMLQDVVDLRQSNWIQRAVKAQGPKTIDQIHADAKEEKALQAAAAAAAPPLKPQPRGGRMGSRGGGGHSGGDEGWTKVTPQKPIRYDPQKMKLSKTQFDESTVTLGPSRGKLGWKSGSGTTKTGSGGYSSGRDSIDSGVPPRSSTPTMINRFSALGASGGQDSSGFPQRPPGRISSQERSKSGSRGSSGSSGGMRRDGREERQALLETARRLTSNENKPSIEISKPSKAPSNPIPDAKPVDEEDLLKKFGSIITEYLHLVNLKEATECYAAVDVPPSQGHLFVKSVLEASLEKKVSDRTNVAKLLCNFVNNGMISADQYLKGVVSNMELAIDLELDLPKVWTCVAEQIAPIFYSCISKVPLSSLTVLAEPLLEEDKASIVVAEILKLLIKKMSIDAVVQCWKDSNLRMEYFLKSGDYSVVMDFLKHHGLEAFQGTSKPGFNFESCQSGVTKQLDLKRTNDNIFDWVETNFDAERRSQPTFVRALTSAVCQKAIIMQGNAQMEVDKNLLKFRSILLKKFIDTDAKELQAVFALQKLWVDLEQPPNILKLLFDALYDEDVISEQTFFKWEKLDDPSESESEGKGVALLSVNPFFTWLRQAEVESDE